MIQYFNGCDSVCHPLISGAWLVWLYQMLKYPQHHDMQKAKVFTIKLIISVHGCMVQQELGRWTSKPRFIDGLHGGPHHSMHLSAEQFVTANCVWLHEELDHSWCLGQRSPATCIGRISVHFGRRSCQEQVVLGSQHCQLNFQLHGLCRRSQLKDGSSVLGSLWCFTAAFFPYKSQAFKRSIYLHQVVSVLIGFLFVFSMSIGVWICYARNLRSKAIGNFREEKFCVVSSSPMRWKRTQHRVSLPSKTQTNLFGLKGIKFHLGKKKKKTIYPNINFAGKILPLYYH